MQELLNQTGFRDVNLQDSKGRTPLHIACVLRNADIVRQLLRRGAFVHAAGVATQATPLHCACLKGNYEVARILIKYGASIDAQTADGVTPLAMLPRTVESKKFAKGRPHPPIMHRLC
jgi:ankyrin repeat protein